MDFFEKKAPFVEITAFYALSLRRYHMDPHRHPRYEIMYVTKGSCHILLDEKEYRLDERQFILLKKNHPHGLAIPQEQPCGLLNLEFLCKKEDTGIDLRELSGSNAAFADLCRKQKDFVIGNDTGNLEYALKDLIRELSRNISPKYTSQQFAALPDREEQCLIRLLFLRAILELSRELSANTRATGIPYLQKACAYIDSHLTEKIRIPDLANQAGINKSYLQSLFSRYLHCTIVDYINQKRLEQAAFLLVNSSLSITDIAFQTGYNSRQHFGLTFEKYYGTSPRTYRQLQGKNISASTEANYYYVDREGKWSNIALEENMR